MTQRTHRDLEGFSGRVYCFDHITDEELSDPKLSFAGVYAMISLYDNVLCGVKRVGFSKNLPGEPRITHAADVHKWGATHYVLREMDDEREAAEVVADIIERYDPLGNRVGSRQNPTNSAP